MSKLNKMDTKNTVYCRLCLQKPKNVSTIIDLFKSKKTPKSIISTLLTHLSFLAIDENDKYSKIICKQCWSIVNNFHSYHERIHKAQNELSAMLSDDDMEKSNLNIKTECGNSAIKLEFNDVAQLQPEIILTEGDIPEHQSIPAVVKYDFDDDDESDKDDDYEPNNSESSAEDEEQNNKDEIINSSESENNLSENDSDTEWVKSCKQSKKKKKKSLKLPPTDNDTDENKVKKSLPKKRVTEKRKVDSDKRKEFESNNKKIRQYFIMECPLCQHPFENYTDIRKHFNLMHQQNRAHIICCGDQKFYYLHQMLDHILVHTNPDTFKCDKCGKIYGNRSKYRKHLRNHDPDIERFNCSQCTKTFTQIYELRYHIRIRHTKDDDKTFACPTCGKKFLTESFLTKHIEQLHSLVPLSAEYICDVCGKQFASRSSLRYHTKFVHLEVESQIEMLQCDVCKKWLKSKTSLREHKITHQFIPSPCPTCQKIFKHPKSLRTHIAKVHQAATFECNVCDKSFKNPTSLREHTASHTGQDLYSCPYCSQTFKSNGNMHNHRKKDHAVEFERDRGKRTLQKLFT